MLAKCGEAAVSAIAKRLTAASLIGECMGCDPCTGKNAYSTRQLTAPTECTGKNCLFHSTTVPPQQEYLSTRQAAAPVLLSAFKQIAAFDECPHLAIGDAALKHPEATIGMDVAEALRSKCLRRVLETARNQL